MKLRPFFEAAVYGVIVLCAPLATAADVDYTSAEQRIRDLEMRIDSLESAKNAVNLAGYNSCDSCSDSCCGASKSCCRRSCWTRPCPVSAFDTEFLLFTVSNSEAENNNGQNDFNAGLRLTYTKVNEQGHIFRVRYFNFGSTLEGGGNRYEMEEIDTEVGRRFSLGGGLKGEFTAGIRYAAFDERTGHNYDTTLGPLVAAQIRGREVLGGTSYVGVRHSWQFGESDYNDPDSPGNFDITEVQLGLEWQREVGIGTLVFRSALEAQYWSGVQDGDTEDIGLLGSATSFGLAY